MARSKSRSESRSRKSSKSPGRPKKKASTPKSEPKSVSRSRSTSRSRGRPAKTASKSPAPTPAKRTPSRSPARSTSASRKAPTSAPAKTPARPELSALRVRSHAVSSAPRVATPVHRSTRSTNTNNGGCKVWGSICGYTKPIYDSVAAPFRGFGRNLRRRGYNTNTLWKIFILFIIVGAIYYTWTYKQRYYRDAYAYAQGYAAGIQAYLNRK